MKVLLFLIISAMMLCNQSLAAQKEPFKYDDHKKRDPLWRLVTSEGNIINYDTEYLITDLNLEGIIFDPYGKSYAIVNGTVIKPNDKIGAYVVKKIEQKKVMLTNGQESFVIEVKKEKEE